MNDKHKTAPLWQLAFRAGFLAPAAFAQFGIPWHTIDGGRAISTSCPFAIRGPYQDNLTYVGFVGQLFMALTVFGLIVLRRREPNLARPFRVPLYPLTPLMDVGILTWYLGNLLVKRFAYSMVGIGSVLAGLPFYVYWTRRAASATT